MPRFLHAWLHRHFPAFVLAPWPTREEIDDFVQPHTAIMRRPYETNAQLAERVASGAPVIDLRALRVGMTTEEAGRRLLELSRVGKITIR